MQKTIQQPIAISGVGLFTGEKVSLKLLPATPNTGVVFRKDGQDMSACLSEIRPAPRCTKLGSIYMVEHLLSALSAYSVDNVIVEVEGSEIVAGDGSSRMFIEMLESAGLVEQGVPRQVLKIQEPIFWSEKDIHLVALPADEFRISYTMHYPKSKFLGSQFFSAAITAEFYKQEIAPCRTFSLYEEILPYIEKGFIKGGGLDNALVIKGEEIMNPEGARFRDEPVRHKVLDLIGDLALIGKPIIGHIISICSGHSSNASFAKAILEREALSYSVGVKVNE